MSNAVASSSFFDETFSDGDMLLFFSISDDFADGLLFQLEMRIIRSLMQVYLSFLFNNFLETSTFSYRNHFFQKFSSLFTLFILFLFG